MITGNYRAIGNSYHCCAGTKAINFYVCVCLYECASAVCKSMTMNLFIYFLLKEKDLLFFLYRFWCIWFPVLQHNQNEREKLFGILFIICTYSVKRVNFVTLLSGNMIYLTDNAFLSEKPRTTTYFHITKTRTNKLPFRVPFMIPLFCVIKFFSLRFCKEMQIFIIVVAAAAAAEHLFCLTDCKFYRLLFLCIMSEAVKFNCRVMRNRVKW